MDFEAARGVIVSNSIAISRQNVANLRWQCGCSAELPHLQSLGLSQLLRKLFSIQAVFWCSVMRLIIKS